MVKGKKPTVTLSKRLVREGESQESGEEEGDGKKTDSNAEQETGERE